jgi:hypothetical protein
VVSLRWRRGGGVTEAGGGGTTYGPTLGAAAVRAGVGPRTVTNPGGGISFNSSGSLQSAINNPANPIGSTFVCSVNNPVWNSTVSTGTQRPTIVFPGAVGQKVIDAAHASLIMMQAGDGTVIKGGTWQNTDTPFAAIITQDDVVMEDAVFTGCFRGGVSIQGLNNRYSYCRFHTNGVKGLGTGNTGPGQTDGIIIEYCDFYGNNTRGLDGGDDAGGFKGLGSGNVHVHHSWFHDNSSFGLWLDTECFDALLEENVCEENVLSGIFYEANYGGVIRRNFVANNGKAGNVGTTPKNYWNCVNLRASDNNAFNGNGNPLQITRNLIDHTNTQTDSFGGLLLLWDHSGTSARSVQNNDVFENQFWLRGTITTNSRVGGFDNGAGLNAFPVWSSDNHFFNNDYKVASTSLSYWQWDTGNGQGVAKTFAEWQGFHSGETRSLI